jgi:hypothetical protein
MERRRPWLVDAWDPTERMRVVTNGHTVRHGRFRRPSDREDGRLVTSGDQTRSQALNLDSQAPDLGREVVRDLKNPHTVRISPVGERRHRTKPNTIGPLEERDGSPEPCAWTRRHARRRALESPHRRQYRRPLHRFALLHIVALLHNCAKPSLVTVGPNDLEPMCRPRKIPHARDPKCSSSRLTPLCVPG